MELERIALPPPGPLELPLVPLELGCAGRLELLLPPGGGTGDTPPPRATLPRGVPPFAPPLLLELERRFLGSPEWLPPHRHEGARRSWQRTPHPRHLFSLEPTPPSGGLQGERDPHSGALRGLVEELLPPHSGVLAPPKQSPPWTEVLEDPDLEQLSMGGPPEADIDFTTNLLTTPPGLKQGVEFTPPGVVQGGSLSLSSLLDTLDGFGVGGGEEGPPPQISDGGGTEEGDKTPKPPPLCPPLRRADSLEELLKKGVETPAKPPPAPPEEGPWAELLDCSSPVPDFKKLLPEPAFQWPFEPDPFQQQAALCLERGHSLLVAAPTSAGKTAVAQYGVALARRHLARAIYTSPVKALSNQKFRELRGTFQDVGLLTGDVRLRPEAACLVVTTEILRSMLYNGSDVIADLEWVIFDEVHYINDAERGVVWEEALILLPPHVKLILLSATVPNALEFAQWVGRTKRRCVRVLSSSRRPVPLEHFLFVGGGGQPHGAGGGGGTPTPTQPHGAGSGLFLIRDAQGTFCTRGYYAAAEALKQLQSPKSRHGHGCALRRAGGRAGGIGPPGAGDQRRARPHPRLLPALRRQAQGGGQAAAAGVPSAERGRIRGFFQRCVARLKGGDRQLPQVLRVGQLLERGVGVHHSGVLPLLKEVVELLFSQGLIKVLLATETFSMGVNMPARTVLFDSIRKHDGTSFRSLLPSEYVQMAGRAGRRGLDTTGTVIILCRGAEPPLDELHRVVMSQFRLTYPMILNLLRAPGPRVEDVMRSSFGEFPLRRHAPAQERRAAELREALAALGGPEEPGGGPGGAPSDLPEYYRAVQGLRRARGVLMRRLAEAPGGQRVLGPGRVLLVRNRRHRNALGVLLQVTPEGSSRTLLVLVLSEKPPGEGGPPPSPPPDTPYPEDELLTRLFLPEGPCGHVLERLELGDIGGVTTKTLKLNPQTLLQELRPPGGGKRSCPPSPAVGAAVQELLRLAGGWGRGGGSGGGPPLLDPLGGLQLRDPEAVGAAATLRELSSQLRGAQCVHSPRFPQQYSQFAARQELLEQLEQLQFQLSDQSLLLLPEYQQRLQVLQDLGYVSAGGSVALGGRLAAALSQQELVLAELVLSGVLSAQRPEETLALLSALLRPPRRLRGDLPPPLREGAERVLAAAQRVGQLEAQRGLGGPSPDEIQDQFGFGLAEVVYEWARGMPFAEIARLAPVPEGEVVRCIQRLEETCRELRQAARLVGDPTLAAKMEAASQMIKRDIVFTASLYTQ